VVESVDSYSKVVNSDFQQQNMIATLTTLLGGLGLTLAAVGLYGVMSCTVEQRTNALTGDTWSGRFFAERSGRWALASASGFR
jgi:hypothetical protein